MRRDRTVGGRFVVHPAFATQLAAIGIDSPERVLDLPGEIVSGHPDRHVVRIELSGFPALYLKRQHRVTQRERFRNWRAGFGWVSRSERERALLDQLSSEGLAAPRWIAAGDDRRGRAFLLVEGIDDTADLRAVLQSAATTPRDRAYLASRIGKLIDQLHRCGFTTPDLTAKHLLVSGEVVTPIDWQSARRVSRLGVADRIRALAALHASIASDLATPRERLGVLRVALSSARADGLVKHRFSVLARRIAAEAKRLTLRRSIREQRLSNAVAQRLVWVAGEAICAVPDVAARWPAPSVDSPFYGEPPGRLSIRLPDGRAAHLMRGRSFDPIGRLIHWLRGKSWRSPGATMGRILFHLDRHGVPAPQLLAFGQRLTGFASAEWFVLHTPPAPSIPDLASSRARGIGRCLKQLHDAGCRPLGDPRSLFGAAEYVSIRDVAAIRLVKRLTRRNRMDDLGRLVAGLARPLRESVWSGYTGAIGAEAPKKEFAVPAGLSQ